MRLRIVTATVLLSWLWMATIPAAVGEQFQVGGISVALELPEGFCGLTRDDPIARLFYEQQDRLQKGINEVVQFAVPCAEAKRLRNGEPVPSFALWLMKMDGDVPKEIPVSMSRRIFITQIASAFPTVDIDQMNTDVAKRVSKEGIGITLKNKFSVLDQTSDTVFIGQVATTQLGASTKDLQVVAAITTISGRAFSLARYQAFEGQPNFNEVLVPLKAAMAKTILANP
jgi:hypothetical protein